MMVSSHFAYSEIEAGEGWVTFPRPFSQQVAEPGLESHLFLSSPVSMDYYERGGNINMLKTIYFKKPLMETLAI